MMESDPTTKNSGCRMRIWGEMIGFTWPLQPADGGAAVGAHSAPARVPRTLLPRQVTTEPLVVAGYDTPRFWKAQLLGWGARMASCTMPPMAALPAGARSVLVVK